MRVLLAGATGYLGSHLGRELKRRGHVVRTLIRRPDQRPAVREFSDEIVVGQVTNPVSLRDVAAGTDAVCSAIGITRQRERFTYEDVDYRGNLNLLQEALRSGTWQFLYVSIFRGRELRDLRLVAAKERFVDALQQADIEASAVRPTGYFSDMAAILRMAQRGAVLLIGDGTRRINPISAGDAAVACRDALEKRQAVVEVGGPDVYTYDEVATLAAAAVRKPVRIWHIPGSVVRVLTGLAAAIAPPQLSGPLQFVEAVTAHDMVAPTVGTEHLERFFASMANAR